MGYLGIVFSDLPNQGRNLRLYTYDPPGTPYYKPPEQGGNIYNTGHFDISLPGGPCSIPDPQGFNDWTLFQNYAQSRGEFRVLVTRSDLAALCSLTPILATQQTPSTSYVPPTITPPGPSTGTTIQITGTASAFPPSQAPPIPVYNPSQPIDTGPPVETQPPIATSDNTLIYAGLGVLALLVLSGRRN